MRLPHDRPRPRPHTYPIHPGHARCVSSRPPASGVPVHGRLYLASAGCVAFFVDAGTHLQRCLIDRATLLLYFGAREDAPDVAQDSLRAFDRHAALISAVALGLARRSGGAMQEALPVFADAVFGHLTRTARMPPRGAQRPVPVDT